MEKQDRKKKMEKKANKLQEEKKRKAKEERIDMNQILEDWKREVIRLKKRLNEEFELNKSLISENTHFKILSENLRVNLRSIEGDIVENKEMLRIWFRGLLVLTLIELVVVLIMIWFFHG